MLSFKGYSAPAALVVGFIVFQGLHPWLVYLAHSGLSKLFHDVHKKA